MAATRSVTNLNSIPYEPQITSEPAEAKPLSQLQRIEVLLRKVFEGHEDFLGWTPD